MKRNGAFELAPSKVDDVEVRVKGEQPLLLNYSAITDLVYNKAKIGLRSKSHGIIIEGNNLTPLVKALEAERATWIREYNPGNVEDNPDITVIRSIQIDSRSYVDGFLKGFKNGMSFDKWLGGGLGRLLK